MTAVLQFQGEDMRHVFIDGEPWFVALDVCTILFPAFNRYAGTTPWLQGLGADEKRVAKRADPATLGIFEGQNMVHQLGMISGSGLYKVILRARPEKNANAKAFQDWVTREVLPSIRKTGGYLLNEDMRATAAADSREEFPLPAPFSAALRKLADKRQNLSGRSPFVLNRIGTYPFPTSVSSDSYYIWGIFFRLPLRCYGRGSYAAHW